jgi:hypothetical protein
VADSWDWTWAVLVTDAAAPSVSVIWMLTGMSLSGANLMLAACCDF